MYTIISGTNRPNSNTLKVAKHYQSFFESKNISAKLLSLEQLTSIHRDENFNKIEKEILIPTEKFIFVMPEYNGSFPGILKLLIDISDVRQCWNFKKIMLVGVANGRAGNLRGLDMMTNMCHYMKMNVYHDKLPISSVTNELENDLFKSENTINTIKNQIEGFIAF